MACRKSLLVQIVPTLKDSAVTAIMTSTSIQQDDFMMAVVGDGLSSRPETRGSARATTPVHGSSLVLSS